MAVTNSPIEYTGEYASKIFTAALEANRTKARGLIRTEDNVKGKIVLTQISGEVGWQTYAETIREADIASLTSGNTLKVGDRVVNPSKIMAFDTWKFDALRKSRWGAGMAAGAENITSQEYITALTGYLAPRMGKSFEKLQYRNVTAATKVSIAAGAATATQKAYIASLTAGDFDGFIASIIKATDESPAAVVQPVVGTTVNASTIAAEYAKIFALIDPAELEEGNVRILAPLSDFQLILQANTNATYKNIFTVTGEGANAMVMYNVVVPVEFVNLPATVRIAGRMGEEGDFIFATDLKSDDTTFKAGPVNNMSDDMFFKMVATGDTTVLNVAKKVLYVS